MWVADILVAFTSICGVALAFFLLKEEWRMFGETRRQFCELPPEVRRKNVRNAILTIAGMLVAACVIFGGYEWCAHTWSSRTGAALAIGVFALIMGCALTAMVWQSFREVGQTKPTGRSDPAQR